MASNNSCDTYAKVDDYLYFGGHLACQDLELLKRLKVSQVIVIKENDVPRKLESIRYRHFSYSDSDDSLLFQKWEEIADWIQVERVWNGVTFICCHKGKSRSSSAVLAWMMKYKGQSLRDGYLQLKEIRPAVDVLKFFMKKLSDYEERILGSTSVEFKWQRGICWPLLPGY